MAQSTVGLVPVWKAATAYTAGQKVIAPNGDVVSAKVNFTSGASYSAANWTASTQDARIGSAEVGVAAALKNLGTPANGTDVDTLQTTGFHPFTNSTNAATMLNLPAPFAGTLEVFYPSASVAYQRFTTFGDINGNPNTGFWVRHRQSSTTWGPWWKVGEAYLGAELVATSSAPVDLDNYTAPGLTHIKSVATAQYVSGLPVSKAGTLENLKPRTATLWTQRFTVQGFMDSSLDGQHAESYFRTRKDATSWNPWQRYLTESVGAIPSGSLTLEATTASFIPLSIGVDGFVYGTTGDPSIVVRSGDSLSTEPETGVDFDSFAGPGTGVAWFTRTSAGFVGVWNESATASSIWFSQTFTGPYAKVQSIGPFNATGVSKPVTIAGVTWMLLGEYINGTYPSTSLARWFSQDGGQTWRVIKRTPLVDVNTNSHMHTALIRPSGRIYTSDGDGPNNFFGYSDDLGKTWVPVATDPDINLDGANYAQPTCLIDFGDSIAMSPDRGPYVPGMWRMDASTHDMKIAFQLTDGGPYGNAAAQYGRSIYAQVGPQGKWAYALMPDGGSGNKTAYVVATPDAGKRWRVVATIPWGTGHLMTGIVGPDRRGYVFMRGYNVPTYGSNAIRAKLIDWEKLSI
ncbi:pyocin knob domain-containing protein [Paenarthrobacter ilicis]|uniref:pyocin knob domain-containing protein n=1 Tax=Paenarthrobacter ilicis TaxID=43665 RepID=UPI003866550F